MPRHVRDPKLDTRSARSKLAQRREPYWRAIAGGLSLGYRKGASGGTWIGRHYSKTSGRRYQSIGAADDLTDADGVHVRDFRQAQDVARKWLGDLARQDRGLRLGPYTVACAVEDYLAGLENDGRDPHSITDTRRRIEAFILPALGNLDVGTLTPDKLRAWRDGLAKRRSRWKHSTVEDGQRARRASANRIWSILRAALNHAFRNGKAESDSAWRRVKPLGNANAARVRFLTVAEAGRLINACDPDFRLLAQAALTTGARYSELVRLTASDFNADAGTISISRSKSGKARHIVLTTEGATLFHRLCAGRHGGDLLFRRADGSAWGAGDQWRPMRAACAVAKINPVIGFHGLRHTWASLSVMAGMPLMVVARNLGHADTRMVEAHYGHLSPSYVAAAVRAHAPEFGFKSDRRIVPLG